MPNSLAVVWTNGDREVALKMVFMYTLNAKLKGGGDIRFIIWGPSSKLLSEDQELHEEIEKFRKKESLLKLVKFAQTSMG